MRRTGCVTAGVSVLALALGACGGSSSGGSSGGGDGGSSPRSVPSFNAHGSTTVQGSEVKLEADDYYFEPSTIRGTPGEKITVEIDNESGTEHNFTVESQDVDVDIEGHEDQTATVTIPASGFVSFFCEYHHSSGMAGVFRAAG